MVSISRPPNRASSWRTIAVVLVEQRAPTGVAELGGPGGGADDVGEEDGGEPPVRVGRRPRPGEELLDLVDELVGVLGEPEVVGAVELDVPGVGDVVGQVPAELRSARSDRCARWSTRVGAWMTGSSSRTSVQHRLAEVVRDRAG